MKIPSKVKDEVFYKTGKTKILDLKETIEFITETAKSNLKEIKTAVLNGDKNWLEIRPLAKIKTID